MLSYYIWCALFALLSSSGSLAQPSDNSSLYRLPKDALPESYDLLLLTNVTRSNWTYEGEVSVRLSVVARTRRVVLHAGKQIKVSKESSLLLREDSVKQRLVPIANQSYDEETQFYALELAEYLEPAGKYLLSLRFVGEVLDDVFGFYRSSYRVNDQIRWIGVTQFSTTFARRAFPCMDEPGFKATFQLRIGHYGNETVSSNTLPESRDATDRADYYITRFSKTPRMSTYLVGWAIHDFIRVNSSDPRIWLWTRVESTDWSKTPALVEGPRLYSALEKWMAVPNPIGKVEHFAVPDFHFSAMENWGLITFRESVPLVTYEATASKSIHDNLLTMGHEYAHTWFGNIVTPDFWSHGWLKEGFANYFTYLAAATINREPLYMEDLFILGNNQPSMLDDSVEHNRTMNGRGVGSPESCKAALDFVTYGKAASVIRMIANVVGDTVFQKAMRAYLADKKYTAATPVDVYEHLESALRSSPVEDDRKDIPVSVSEFVESWANQPNYPLVRASRRNGSIGEMPVTLSQEVFRFGQAANESRYWWIPVRIVAASGNGSTESSTWLGPRQRTVRVSSDDWFLVNARQIGVYRVSYDAENWAALSRLLNTGDFRRLRSIDRAGLVDDVFNLARAGYESYALALNLARYLRREDEYAPWAAATRAIRLLDGKLRDKPDARMAFRRYAIELITPIYENLTFTGLSTDSRVRRMHRSTILSTACSLDLADCLSNAKSIFDYWIADENKLIPADLKAFVYNAGILNGTDDHWITLWQRFFKAELHSEKVPMIQALACTSNPDLLVRLFESAIQPRSDVAKQYRLSIIQSIIAGSSKNIDTVLNYIQDNLNNIINLKGDAFLGDILSTIGKEITSDVQMDKLTRFVETNVNLLGSALGAGTKAIKSAKDNIAWINTSASQIFAHLSSK